MLRRLLFFLLFAANAVQFSWAQSVEVRGDRVSEALQNQLEQELPPSQIPETRFEARRIAEIAAERLGNYLNSEGYFSAVATPGFEPGPPIVPHVTVDPGARFKLASVGIDYLGTRVPDRVDAASLSAISPQTDDFITPEAVIQSEGAIISTLRDEGYAFARAEPPHVIGDAAAATLSVTYRIDPGAKVVLGSVDFGDGLRMRRRALDVLVPFSEGTLYHPDRLAEFNRRLGATRLFSVFNAQLSPTPSRITPDGAAVHNILLTLIERDRYTISAGASFSSSEGAGVELGWTRRNFTRRGDILTVRAIGAAQERRLGIEWRYPNALGYARSLELSANAGREETDAFDRDSLVATISLDIERNPRLTYAFAASNDFTRETDTQGERDLQILSISGAARLDQTDSVLDPKKGWRVDIRLEPGTVIGDEAANYVSTVGQASYYQPLDEQARWIAATRLRSGFVFGADTLNLPTSRRFFAGGGGSARGYAFQSIGPEDSTGQPVGGRGLMEAAAELRWRRSKTLGFAAFIDGASVTARDVPTFNDMRFGVGIGVRYYTIVGPIRLDIATPLDPRDDDDPVQLYISIGQAF